MSRAFVLMMVLGCTLAWSSEARFEPLPDAEILSKLKERIGTQTYVVSRKLIRHDSDLSIELESMMAFEGDYPIVTQTLNEPKRFREWALNNINLRPNGNSYFIHIVDLLSDARRPQVVTILFDFNLPLFKEPLRRTWVLTSQETEQEFGKVFTLEADTDQGAASPLGSAFAIAKVFRRADSVWMYLSGRVRLRNWLLYQAMPDSILGTESGERLEIIIANYLLEQSRLREQRRKNP